MHTPLLANRLGRWLAAAAFGLLAAPVAQAQLAGPKAIPGDYATVAAAITALNAQGVGAGGVTFNIAAGYTETFASSTAGAITATGTAANPIVFQKTGTGANPLITAAVGVSTTVDAIISLAGSDYVTLDGLSLVESVANTTATTQMEFGFALARASATDGAQFNTIRNCVVTLNKTNINTIGIAGLASTTANTTAVTATSTAGANSNNKVYGNVVTNALTGIYFAAGSSTTLANYDQSNEIGVTAGNTIGNFGGTASGYAAGGTYQNGLKITGNTINSTLNYTSATASTAVAASTVTATLRGIYTPTGTSSNLDITNNVITLASGATASQLSGIENGMGSTAASNTVNITGNTLSINYATATTATIYAIYNTASAATTNLTGNTITGNTIGGTASAAMVFNGVYNTGTGTTVNIGTNLLTNNAIAGSGTVTLVYGGSPTTLNITNNTITGNTKTGGVTTTGTWYCIQALTTAATVTGNTVNNNSIAATGTTAATLYGYYDLSSPTAETVTGNTFTNLSIGGTSTATAHVVAGIYSNPTASTVKNYSQNTIGNLAATPGGTVYGIYTVTGATVGINGNKIYALSAGASTGLAYGLFISSGVTVTASNNLIGDLQAPASTSLLAVTGIHIGGGTTVNAYYNTIYLSATSTGATFGTSGIYLGSTSATLDARNNIVVNKSTAVGTGGYTAALRRISGTAATAPANLATATNNNLYYAGTPSATNLIYVEGTTTATNAQQTLAAYKALVTPRESSSVTEDVPFVSTTGTAATFLHISPTVPTQVEGNATPISSVTTDFDGDARNATTPDLGADEGTFQSLDVSGPSITFTPLTFTGSTANRTLTVTITDVSGISTTVLPRLFYRKGTSGTFVSALATSTSGSTYTFTFDYAAVGGVALGDVIQYYVVAQDVPGNVSSNPAGGTFSTPPTSIFQYTINALSGVYYVGTSTSPAPTRTYATLTAAAQAYNNNGLGGAVTFLLLDNAYSATTGETFPVAFFNNPDASATNTLTIKPNTGVTATVTAAGSVLALASTRYVTIDGSNTTGGTTRNLTLTNTTLTAGTYGLGLLLQTGQAQANQFATVRNVNVLGGGATANATTGIVLNGADNDNVTLQNNNVQGVTTGIQAFGTANTSVGGLDNLVITGNVVGPTTAAAGANINQFGIVVASALSPVVSRNEVQNLVNPTATFSSNMTGILLQDVQTGSVTRNTVHNLVYNGTSTAKLYGISTQISTSTFNTAANASATRFDNNLVYALNSTATSGSWNTSGINNNGGYGDQYYYNTVYLSGQLSNGTAGSAAFSNGNGIVSTAATNLDVRNNIFSIIGGTGVAATPLYAHYTTLANYTGSNLNYNDLYVTVGGTTGVARIGRLNSVDATTLADWRTATSQEANSVSADPAFTQVATAPFNLTPTAAALNNVATPIASVTLDYAGATRGTTPDIGAYEFTPASVDLAATALTGPAATGCYGAAESVIVTLTNNANAALNFALNPSTVTVTVTKPDNTTQTFTTTLSTGTLAVGATQAVTLPGTLNLSAAGTYSFAVTTTTTGDGNPGNDNLTATRTVVGTAAQPQLVTFTGFTGSNLATVFPGWTEATGATLPAGTTSAWTNTTGVGGTGNTTAKINLFSTGKNDWIVSPKFLATNSTVLTFDAGLTDYNATTADPAGMTGTDDFMEVRVSTDCGQTFARIPGFAQFNAGNQPSNGSLTNYSINLSAYAGQQIILGFFASEGTVANTPDYDFHLDNISVSSPLPIDLTPVALLTPTATQGCYTTAETVTVSVRNLGTQALDFAVNPATVTAVVTTPGTPQTLTAIVSTGTLAPGAVQTVTLTPTLDMSAIGTYSFAITATVTGDQVTGNDALAAVTRTVAAPVAGTVTTNNNALCISGTTTLTLTGAANGSIQWQQSADNTTFTDISGATSATYTTAVLTSTTYFRAQVRCGTQTAATSNVSTITVSNPLVATTNTPLTICSGSTATLTATASTGASVRFFSAATGGTALAGTTAGSYTTPALTASTTYYAEAFTGSQENVGKTSTTGADGSNSSGGLYFTTTGALTIANVTVYRTANAAAGTATVYLLPGSTTSITGALATATVTVPANTSASVSPTVLALNFAVPAAGNYTLYLGASTPNLIRDTSGSTFPYTSPSGAVSITNGSLAGYYYFFYNWQIGSECASAARTPVQVNVTAPATASFPAATASTCGTSPYTLTGTVGGSATAGTYTSSGTGTFAPNATTLGATYTPSAADVAAGTVTITLTSTAVGTCPTASATLTLGISPAPVATFSYPTATTYCAGSTSTVTPTLGTGAAAGVFSSTAGLSIDPTSGVITLSTSTAGTYTVTNTIAASGTCAAATATATLTINALPATPTVTVTYPTRSTALLTSSAAPAGTTYQWYLGGVAIAGATSQTYTANGATAPGAYSLCIINAAGCQACTNVTTVTATAQPLAGSSLTLFPNPTADGQLTLQLSGYAKAVQLTVVDALGRVVLTKQVAAGQAEAKLDLSGAASGVYTLRAVTEGGTDVRRIVRQ